MRKPTRCGTPCGESRSSVSLVDESIQLPRRSVVTTTWGEWRSRHPETTVLALDTGFRRDYGEGVAYQEYFATDELMFNTARTSDRLPNKAEVLGLVFSDAQPLAISASYAAEHPLIHESVGEQSIVVLTDSSGAIRAYAADNVTFKDWDQESSLSDSEGRTWTLEESKLVRDDGVTLSRLPSHNAFWFGWYGAYSSTRLIS